MNQRKECLSLIVSRLNISICLSVVVAAIFSLGAMPEAKANDASQNLNRSRVINVLQPINVSQPKAAKGVNGWSPIGASFESRLRAGKLIELRQFRDHLAVVNFDTTDASGCVGSITILGLSDNDPTLNQGIPGIFLVIWRYDFCNDQDQLLVQANVPVAASNFEISSDLKSARLTEVVPVCDFVSGNCFDVSINLTWSSGDRIHTDPYHSVTAIPGIFVSGLIWNSFWRVCEISGTVTDGTTDYTYGSVNAVAVITKTVFGSIAIQVEKP